MKQLVVGFGFCDIWNNQGLSKWNYASPIILDVTKTHPIIYFIMLVWLKPHEQIKIVVEEMVKLNCVTQIVLARACGLRL